MKETSLSDGLPVESVRQGNYKINTISYAFYQLWMETRGKGNNQDPIQSKSSPLPHTYNGKGIQTLERKKK